MNVALLLSSHRGSRLEYRPSFERLRCIAPGVDAEFLQITLDWLHRSIADCPPPAACQRIRELSAQFAVSSARQLAPEITDSEVEVLVHRYLAHPKSERTRTPSRHRIQTKVHDWLMRAFDVPEDRVLRRARPKDYLPRGLVSELKDESFQVARAVVGDSGTVLIDGLDLATQNTDSLERRSLRIAFAYHELAKVRSRANLQRATVLFNSQVDTSPHLDYAVDRLISESDLTIDVGVDDESLEPVLAAAGALLPVED